MHDIANHFSRWMASVPHLGLYLGIGWALYLLGLGGWIVLQKRAPAATLGWLLGLAALPYVGFLIYVVFGPQRIKRNRVRRARARVALLDEAPWAYADEAAELAALAHATSGLPASTAIDVRLLIDGGATYQALLEAVACARHHVHLEYYIFAADRTGTMLRDALVERARAGVAVRVLLDAVGSSKCPRDFFAPLIEAGGEFAWFHPMHFGRIWRRTWLNLRSHRKIAVIDGNIGFTGGINVTDEENERLRDDAYRDLHLRIEGDAVRGLQLLFVEDWIYATGRRDLISSVVQSMPDLAPGPIAAQVLGSGPDSPWEAIHRVHVAAIHEAKRRVWLATPYFVPSEAAKMALTSAALGGLDVRLLVPKHSDSRLVTLAARSYFDHLLAAGVRVYEYGPRMLHTKAMLVDDDLALIGSANFDARSFSLNFEVCMLFRDQDIATELAHLFEGELRNAPRVRADRPSPLWSARLPEALARLLSPLL
ncbi:MAG: cardiolipin synthase [Luteimonas sp.]